MPDQVEVGGGRRTAAEAGEEPLGRFLRREEAEARRWTEVEEAVGWGRFGRRESGE